MKQKVAFVFAAVLLPASFLGIPTIAEERVCHSSAAVIFQEVDVDENLANCLAFAEDGDAKAQSDLGTIYSFGTGVTFKYLTDNAGNFTFKYNPYNKSPSCFI